MANYFSDAQAQEPGTMAPNSTPAGTVKFTVRKLLGDDDVSGAREDKGEPEREEEN